MGGLPAAIGSGLSKVGDKFGGGNPPAAPGFSDGGSVLTLPAKTAENSGLPANAMAAPGSNSPLGRFWGSAKQSLNDSYVQPWKNAISDFKGNSSDDNGSLQAFFNAPAVETPAQRNRRMMQG